MNTLKAPTHTRTAKLLAEDAKPKHVCFVQAYAGAISRAVARKKAEDGEAHVLDVGSGSGLLAVLAAKAGVSSVVTCELHEGLAAAARRVSSASMILSENPRKHPSKPYRFCGDLRFAQGRLGSRSPGEAPGPSA